MSGGVNLTGSDISAMADNLGDVASVGSQELRVGNADNYVATVEVKTLEPGRGTKEPMIAQSDKEALDRVFASAAQRLQKKPEDQLSPEEKKAQKALSNTGNAAKGEAAVVAKLRYLELLGLKNWAPSVSGKDLNAIKRLQHNLKHPSRTADGRLILTAPAPRQKKVKEIYLGGIQADTAEFMAGHTHEAADNYSAKPDAQPAAETPREMTGYRHYGGLNNLNTSGAKYIVANAQKPDTGDDHPKPSHTIKKLAMGL